MVLEPDVFTSEQCKKLLNGKNVIFLGDSNVRALYKDIILLSQNNDLIPDKDLKNKMEPSFCGDKLTYHGKQYNGRDYREERRFEPKRSSSLKASFYYLTRLFDSYVQEIFNKFIGLEKPDVIIMNSCLWDVTRWGPNGVNKYKENFKSLINLFEKKLPLSCMVIWMTAPPVSQIVRGGFLVPQLQFLQYSIRYHVGEANNYSAKVMRNAGYDVLDQHYYLNKFLRWRTKDGVHWYPPAVRFITNLILTHICLAWGCDLPKRLMRPVKRPFDQDENVCPKKNYLQSNDQNQANSATINMDISPSEDSREQVPLHPPDNNNNKTPTQDEKEDKGSAPPTAPTKPAEVFTFQNDGKPLFTISNNININAPQEKNKKARKKKGRFHNATSPYPPLAPACLPKWKSLSAPPEGSSLWHQNFPLQNPPAAAAAGGVEGWGYSALDTPNDANRNPYMNANRNDMNSHHAMNSHPAMNSPYGMNSLPAMNLPYGRNSHPAMTSPYGMNSLPAMNSPYERNFLPAMNSPYAMNSQFNDTNAGNIHGNPRIYPNTNNWVQYGPYH